jgi:hypothetical protein
MKTKKYLSLLMFIFALLHIEIVFADSSSHEEYFKALKEIQQIPKDATPISACSLEDEKAIISRLDPADANTIFGGKPKTYKTGITDNYGETIKVFKGDFSNSGNTEYLFMSEGGGSLATNGILDVYKLSEGHLVSLHFSDTVIKNILGDKDFSSFYMWMPDPAVFVQNNNTYIRYMGVPPNDDAYNKAKLLVCTYLWKGGKFKLVGPKNCIGYRQ